MIIDQLPEISSVQTTDEMPIERGQTTYKTPISKMCTAIFASPTLTGTPKAPTAGVSTDNTQIATTAFANRAANNAVSTFVRPNLLDNWYFVGGGSQLGYGVFPVNQRGQTSYSTVGYSIDRWTKGSSDGSVVVVANWLTLSGQSSRYISQPVDGTNIYGKTITISALFADGTLVTGSGVLPIETVSERVSISANTYDRTIISCYKTPSNICAAQIFTNKPGDVTLAAVKLELGPEQTLAHQENGAWVLNEIPDYTAELAKCQAYLLPISALSRTRTNIVLDNVLGFDVPVPVTMAKTPAIVGTLRVSTLTGSFVTGFTFDVGGISDNAVRIRASKTSHGLTDGFIDSDAVWYLSAEP